MIADAVGMSVAMVERYTRFENKRASGKAALVLVLIAETSPQKGRGSALSSRRPQRQLHFTPP